jgi:hypothetical protein
MRKVDSAKEKAMPPARPPGKPRPTAIKRLMKDFQGPDKEASRRAFKVLVLLGSPIRELLASPECDPWGDGSYSYDDMAAVINESGSSDAKVLAGLAQAVVGEGSSIRLAAIQVCKGINPPHQLVIDTLVQVLCDRNEYVRREAARALGELRVAAPSVLKGLAAALRDSELTVVCEAMSALGDIGAPAPEVLAGLVHFLGDVNSSSCVWALLALQKIGAFDQAVHDAVRQVATSTFSFGFPLPLKCALGLHNQQPGLIAFQLLANAHVLPSIRDAISFVAGLFLRQPIVRKTFASRRGVRLIQIGAGSDVPCCLPSGACQRRCLLCENHGIEGGHCRRGNLLAVSRHFARGEAKPQTRVLRLQPKYSLAHGHREVVFGFPDFFWRYNAQRENGPACQASADSHPDQQWRPHFNALLLKMPRLGTPSPITRLCPLR